MTFKKTAGEFVFNVGKKIAQKLSGQGKTKFTGKAINTTKPGTNLTFKRKEQDDFIKYRQKLHDSAKFDTPTKNKLKMKQPLYKINKRKSDYKTPDEPKFSKGGRAGFKKGTKKGLGMQSVIYGLDKNPKITAADPKAKFIAAAKKKTKKKVI